MYRWWTGLAANNVPRKLWLSLEGHVDPFEYRRTAWVDTLNRWFDYWLQGVPNGIMDQPRVDIETSADTFTTYADWPIPNTTATDVYLGGRGAGKSGSLLLGSGGDSDNLSFTDNSLSETNAINTPNGSQANRLTFLTAQAQDRPAPLRAAGHRPAGVALDPAEQPRRAAGRLRPRVARRPRRLRRRHEHHDPQLLRRLHGRRQRLLPRGHQARAGRHAVARLQGHPGLLEPRLADRRPGVQRGPGPEVRVQVPESCRRSTRSRPATRSASCCWPTTRWASPARAARSSRSTPRRRR